MNETLHLYEKTGNELVEQRDMMEESLKCKERRRLLLQAASEQGGASRKDFQL